jgi:hypothetical protein
MLRRAASALTYAPSTKTTSNDAAFSAGDVVASVCMAAIVEAGLLKVN